MKKGASVRKVLAERRGLGERQVVSYERIYSMCVCVCVCVRACVNMHLPAHGYIVVLGQRSEVRE